MTRVLVTGGLGFIGHHLIETILNDTPWEVVTLDRIDATSTLHRLRCIDKWPERAHRVSFVWHDLRATINKSVDTRIGDIDIVLHLAAQTHVDRSIAEPRMFIEDNIIGTLNLLEWWRERKGSLFVNFGTDEVFGPARDGYAFKEWDRYYSANPYSASKAGAEELTNAYSNTYGFHAICTHTMNVFAERQHPEKFVPLVISKVLKGEVVKIHADLVKGSGSRFYIHARNVSEALLWLVEHELNSVGSRILFETNPRFDKWNIVGEREITNLDMARFIAEVLGKPLHHEFVDCNTARPGHDFRYALDGEKLRNAGFNYSMTLEQSLTKTIRWFAQNPEWLRG